MIELLENLSLLGSFEISRGMLLYFFAAGILLAFPFIGKKGRAFAAIVFAVFAARGFGRILDETDLIRAAASLLPGFAVGLTVAIILAAVYGFFELIGRQKRKGKL